MSKRQYGKWSADDMKKALEEYASGKIKFNKCCLKYNIPKPTFKGHVDGKVKRRELEKAEQAHEGDNPKKITTLKEKRRINGRLPAIPVPLEDSLVKHILLFEECLFGLTITDVRKLAYDDWYCFLCSESVIEDMIQCSKCKKWAHEKCAGGSSIVVTFQMQRPLLVSGGPLIGDYEFTQLHFHWGANNGEGSENTINNSSYPLEAHAVFYQKAYGSPQEAVDHPDGLAVLSFLYQVSDKNNENYGRIVNVLPHVKEPDTNTTIYNFPELQKLIVEDTSVYYVYGGSLTTPPCNEAVTWIEFTDTVPIAPNQIEIFRQLNGEYGKLNHNFRPVQPVHGRIIRMNRGLDHLSNAIQHSYSWCTIIIIMFCYVF